MERLERIQSEFGKVVNEVAPGRDVSGGVCRNSVMKSSANSFKLSRTSEPLKSAGIS